MCCRQVLSVLNVILNFLLMNRFLSGKFLDLGWRWLLSLPSPESSLLLLADVFPKMTLCTWKQMGKADGLEVSCLYVSTIKI